MPLFWSWWEMCEIQIKLEACAGSKYLSRLRPNIRDSNKLSLGTQNSEYIFLSEKQKIPSMCNTFLVKLCSVLGSHSYDEYMVHSHQCSIAVINCTKHLQFWTKTSMHIHPTFSDKSQYMLTGWGKKSRKSNVFIERVDHMSVKRVYKAKIKH